MLFHYLLIWLRERWPDAEVDTKVSHKDWLRTRIEGADIRFRRLVEEVENGSITVVWNDIAVKNKNNFDLHFRFEELYPSDPDFFNQLETVVRRAIENQQPCKIIS